jgi:hypothetical protein
MMSTALKTKMNPEVKKKWIDALRSGWYDQGSEKLRSDQGYCCLGVLCDLYSQEKNTDWEFRGITETNLQPQDYWYFEGESEFLPESVKEWAGLPVGNPSVRVDVTEEEDGDDWFYNDEIANLNDSGYTFNELSKLIEQQF